jgi:hypothetical protein
VRVVRGNCRLSRATAADRANHSGIHVASHGVYTIAFAAPTPCFPAAGTALNSESGNEVQGSLGLELQ